MSDQALLSWGVPRLSQLLPLDEESLRQILSYAASLSKDEGAEHLKNLLGDSPAAFEFVSAFSSRRDSPQQQPTHSSDASSAARSGGGNNSPAPHSTTTGKKNKKTKPPLHSAGPPRRPENFGNVVGGYKKADLEEDYMPSSSASRSKRGGESSYLTAPIDTAQANLSNASSRTQSPAPPKQTAKPPPSASGPMLSDLLPNVKSKAARGATGSRAGGGGSGTATPSSKASGAGTSLTTNNISDLTSAIALLEVSTNPTLNGNKPQKCNCYATLHPLFTPAPNCLHCGKIICSLEGLQPCSFCGAALLSADEIQGMIRELRAERGQEKMRAHNDSVHREGGPGMYAGSNTAGGGSSKLDAARAHRDKLLQFQAQNAKRTRVVDEAADFETPNVASTLWMSPAQRALALKKQQRVMREIEEKSRPEWEKKKTVMSLDIKGGRVTRVYQSAGSSSAAAEEETAEEEADADLSYDPAQKRSGEAFSRNPLLAAGGLMRPIWKGADGQPVDSSARKERKQAWRRVQDDNDDNEQWILDGGLHGYS